MSRMKNLDVTSADRTSVPSTVATFPTAQHDDGGYDDMTQTIPFDKDNNANNNNIFFNSVENKPVHNAAEMTQNQRSVSEASFGSFSLDEEFQSDADGTFGDLPVENFIATPATNAVVNGEESQHQKSMKEAPRSVDTFDDKAIEYQNEFSENKQSEHMSEPKTALTENESATYLSPPQSTANDSGAKKAPPSEDNNTGAENLNAPTVNATGLPALGTGPKEHQGDKLAQEPQILKNKITETQNTNNHQPYKNDHHHETSNEQIIELLDDDKGTDAESSKSPQMTSAVLARPGVKRSRSPEINRPNHTNAIVPGSSFSGYRSHNNQYDQSNDNRTQALPSQNQRNKNMIQKRRDLSSDPHYMSLPQNYIPTWENPLPPLIQQTHQHKNEYKHFELSLLNVSEFTITGLPVTFDGRPSSVLGFRKIVKEVSRGYGKAVFERDNPKQSNNNMPSNEQYSSYGENKNSDGGKWRIPLGAYRAFFSYLKSDRMCKVQGIPEDQLKIASLGKARLEKGFPTAQKLISSGVPEGLATALAPFQRGGVDFVFEKHGRALIADDMGLGKTIQSIASMSVYHDEWPLLILTPSSARYHWAAEFNNWLGSGSSVNNKSDSMKTSHHPSAIDANLDPFVDDGHSSRTPRKPMRLLKEPEIHVMLAGKEKIFPSTETRIVVVSYGLATSLVESGKLYAGLFRCAIVDESHMLKNMKTKRTSKLVPILHATKRCILLSGTPAMARPTELWPQLKILSTERDGWWDNEDDFVRKYVQRTSAIRRAELHTMLTGTVMIRRMKHDILKSLPNKQREKAIVDVVTPDLRREFHMCMKLLREGKGVMAKIAKRHPVLIKNEKEINPKEDINKKMESLRAEYNEKCRQKFQSIRYAMQSVQMNNREKENLMNSYLHGAKTEIDVWFKEQVQELQESSSKATKEEELDKKSILNKMYSMTAKAKIPLIADLVGKWLDDPTKGKLCIFAHHIYVLDEIVKLVGLSNTDGSRKRFIRIDGCTSPKERQAQIVAFQNDPDIRIAVLGITAAGVAVTLTASSTVWFAELFWTPALMIQAEDRCHRIGQNAVVKCLYFVASGTLDVLLWDLLEKKFQDLGEFVEGKEKMKIVVQHTFKSVKEVQSIFMRSGDDDLDNDAKQNETDPEAEGNDFIKLESDLQEDIVQLAHEEMGMISQGDDEDGGDIKIVGKPANAENLVQVKVALGQTEDEAICLSDDEDESFTNSTKTAESNSNNNLPPSDSSGENTSFMNKSRVLHSCRFYKQYFEGSSYGIQLLCIGNRLAVANNRFGKSKPALGDVLIAVNGYRVPLNCGLEHVCRFMKDILSKGTVELLFVEDQDFVKEYSPSILEQRRGFELFQNGIGNKKPKSAPPTNAEDVIEILDED